MKTIRKIPIYLPDKGWFIETVDLLTGEETEPRRVASPVELKQIEEDPVKWLDLRARYEAKKMQALKDELTKLMNYTPGFWRGAPNNTQ